MLLLALAFDKSLCTNIVLCPMHRAMRQDHGVR